MTVYYNPKDPPVGVLEPGGGAWFAALSATIGVCCLAFGFVLWRA